MNAIDLGPRYEHIRELGRGGMGRVFLVRDLHLRRELALKLLHEPPLTPLELEQVQREFALLAGIENPAIARAHDFGYVGDLPYFTSDYIPGENLGRMGLLKETEVLEMALALARPLAFLHRGKVLHLDLKPSNIIVPAGPSAVRAVLIDFGLFRRGFTSPPGAWIRGSLPYMAPEYFREEDLGPWTDVYGLGVTLYRAATGTFPRAGPSADDPRLLDEAAWAPAPLPPSRIRPSLPPALDGVILKCLALDPCSRFPSGAELLSALERLEGGGSAHVTPATSLRVTVGRSAELAKLDRAIDALLEGKDPPAAIFITAGPGMGQTHFLSELKVRAQTKGFRFYLHTGFPGQAGPPGDVLSPLGVHLEGEDPRAAARWKSFLSRLRRPRRPTRAEASEGERRLRRAGEAALAAGRVREPFFLAVDGLQHLDEVSIALLIDLIRDLDERSPRPRIGIAVGYREEGTCVPLLRELTRYLLQPKKGEVITLGPLRLEESIALYELAAGASLDRSGGLALLQESGGSPARITALARGAGAASPEAATSSRRSPAAPMAPLDSRAARVLLCLRLLGRPARTAELSRFLRISPARMGRILRSLKQAHRVSTVEEGSGREGWILDPAAGSLRASGAAEERWIHARIARALISAATRREPGALVEALSHFRAGGMAREVARYGLAAARHLKSHLQNRSALEAFRAVLEAIPSSRRGLRLEVALEMADLHARVGDLDEGIQTLREALSEARGLPRPLRARAILSLASLHCRRGDFQRADRLFSEGFHAAGGGARLGREDRLHFLNEHAAMKAVSGEHREALSLCREGLRLAGRSRSFPIRELALNLHATRANVALRNYDFDAAIRDFQTALEEAEAIGSLASQATVLNNLGVVYIQCDRYPEAVRAFREAERSCLRLDEGPSLASIHGNLAVLHSKTGDFEAMERALLWGTRLVPAVIGRRQELFLKHARGLCLLHRGRFAESARELEAAVRLGEEIGDRHVTAFDEVYRAEALIFEARYGVAHRELSRLGGPGRPERPRLMALARLAFLSALCARPGEAREAAAAHAAVRPARAVPSLEAWDGLFLGWALSLQGDAERALLQIEPAEGFFRRHGLRPALALAAWVRAEMHLIRGEPGKSRESLAAAGFPFPPRPAPEHGDLAAVLFPLLGARLVLEEGSGGRALAADLLAEAAAALAGNSLPEWAARLEALRAALRPGDEKARALAEEKRREIAGGLHEDAREGYLESDPWRIRTASPGTSVPERQDPAPATAEEGPSKTGTVALPRAGGAFSRASLAARSPGMRRLLSILDRLKGTELPVLILGETGSGKEVVARIIHQESRRAARAFQVLDCAAIPPGLLEAELFGARAGAFTDLREDRPGILALTKGGTVLLDEIAGTPPEVQAKLLRVLSAGSIRPLGAEEEVPIDVRFLFSTSRDLELEVREGRLRADLAHRIRVVPLEVPPLRERVEDIPELVEAFLSEGAGLRPSLDRGALERLRGLPWPGNVRELRNLLLRLRLENPRRITAEAVDLARGDPRTSTLFPRGLLDREGLPALKDRLERDYIVHHHRRLGGDTAALGRFLGLGRRQLYRRCQRLKIRLRKKNPGRGD